jgi:hypothetical protein
MVRIGAATAVGREVVGGSTASRVVGVPDRRAGRVVVLVVVVVLVEVIVVLVVIVMIVVAVVVVAVEVGMVVCNSSDEGR